MRSREQKDRHTDDSANLGLVPPGDRGAMCELFCYTNQRGCSFGSTAVQVSRSIVFILAYICMYAAHTDSDVVLPRKRGRQGLEEAVTHPLNALRTDQRHCSVLCT